MTQRELDAAAAMLKADMMAAFAKNVLSESQSEAQPCCFPEDGVDAMCPECRRDLESAMDDAAYDRERDRRAGL